MPAVLLAVDVVKPFDRNSGWKCPAHNRASYIYVMIYPEIKAYCDTLKDDFDFISPERKRLLSQLSDYISFKKKSGKSVSLVYICTHNSRRSHFGQVWGAVAASYFGIGNISTYSGGTEATAFNINAITALKKIGFKIEASGSADNPVYSVDFGGESNHVQCFSKVFDHPVNPGTDFAAIMTCSDAEKNCPFIPGADLRIGTSYDDPKAYDGTKLQDEKYSERCRQIAAETFYVFSKVNF